MNQAIEFNVILLPKHAHVEQGFHNNSRALRINEIERGIFSK
jgi:hypothetical protein